MAQTQIKLDNGIGDIAAKADASSSALMAIDFPHHEIHEGDHYFVIYSVADLGAATTPNDMMTLSWTTPNTTTWMHFAFEAHGTAGWRVRLIENSTTGGTTGATGRVAALNSNRNSANTSTIISDGDSGVAGYVGYDATLALGGTTLVDGYIEGGAGPFASGTQVGVREEIVLKQNTNYQLSLFGTDNNPGSLYMSWYEHADDA